MTRIAPRTLRLFGLLLSLTALLAPAALAAKPRGEGKALRSPQRAAPTEPGASVPDPLPAPSFRAFAAPANDSLTAPLAFPLNTRNEGQDNSEASIDPSEPLSFASGFGCRNVPGGVYSIERTLWYRVTGTGGRIILDTFGSAFGRNLNGDVVADTIMAVYPASSPVRTSLIDCNDDLVPGGVPYTSRIVLNSTAGAEYLVQVGGCHDPDCGTDNFGFVQLSAVANDDRPFAATVDINSSGTGLSNVGASTENDLPTTCSGSPSFGRTVWLRFRAPFHGRVRFSANSLSFAPTATLYRADSITPEGCAAGRVTDSLPAVLEATVLPNTDYVMQVGSLGAAAGSWDYSINFIRNTDVDGDSSPIGIDCNDSDPAIRPGVRDVVNGVDDDCDGIVDPDRDGDGVTGSAARGPDCNDANPAIRPGAPEIPGNNIDENCDGQLAFNEVRSRVAARLIPGRRFVRFKALTVVGVPAGATVTARCSGRGCARKKTFRRVFRRADASYSLTKFVRRVRIYSRTRLEIRILAPGFTGKVVTIRRSRRTIAQTERCLPPGASRPQRC